MSIKSISSTDEPKKRTLLPDEYEKNITNSQAGWHGFTMTSAEVQLNEADKIDEVSALPTPWARMQFVEMAFKKWQGNTANETKLTLEEKRIINYTFDLLELVFFQNFYAVQLVFNQIPDFAEDNYFAKATNTFFKFPRPTLIKILKEDGRSILLGSTSPYTLVYPAYHYISESYPVGEKRKLFDKNADSIILIGKRPKLFLEFLKWVSQNLPGGTTHPSQSFKKALSSSLGNINLIKEDFFEKTNNNLVVKFKDFDNSIKAEPDKPVKPENSDEKIKSEQQSNFEIKKLREGYQFESSYLYAGGKIIIGDHHSEGSGYLKDFPLQLKTQYPEVGNQPRGILPNTIIRQEWLHESDFFTPKLLKMPYDLNGDSFHLGIMENTLNKNFALPLTENYFENIHHWDVDKNPLFNTSLQIINEHVKIRAKVQIRLLNDSTIQVSRLFESDEIDQNISNSAWGIKVFPNYYVANHEYTEKDDSDNLIRDNKTSIGELPYFINIYDETGTATLPITTKLEIYNLNNASISPLSSKVRKKKVNSETIDSLINYKTDTIPHRLKIVLDIGAAKERFEFSFLPNFKKKEYNYNENNGVRIAFDFGTTNTAIAYSFLGANNDVIVANFKELKENTSYTPDTKVKSNGKYENIKYEDIFAKYSIEPILYDTIFRSVINYSIGVTGFINGVNFNTYLNPEIPNPDTILNETRSEFKWDINKVNFRNQSVEWVSHFISSNLMMLKYLLLQNNNNQNLNDIQLAWFYPLAFDETQRVTIRTIWENLRSIVFPKLLPCVELDESIAPFINSVYFNQQNATKVLNIDIGGGTTDLCMMQGSETLLKLSLPLAGRNVLGDLYNNPKDPLMHNGVVWFNSKPPVVIDKTKKPSHEQFIKEKEENKKAILEKASPIIYFFCYSVLKYVKLALDLKEASNNYPDIIRFSGNGANMIRSILSNEGGIEYSKSLQTRNHSFSKFVRLIFGKEIIINFSTALKEDTVLGGVKYLRENIYLANSSQSSLEYEILGENINSLAHSTNLGSINSYDGKIEINSSEGSYMLNSFLPGFRDLLEKESQLFRTLFLTDGDAKRMKLLAYIKNLIKDNDVVKLQQYIFGGINDSGVSISQLKSSLLMFELQGIINEMTREV